MDGKRECADPVASIDAVYPINFLGFESDFIL